MKIEQKHQVKRPAYAAGAAMLAAAFLLGGCTPVTGGTSVTTELQYDGDQEILVSENVKVENPESYFSTVDPDYKLEDFERVLGPYKRNENSEYGCYEWEFGNGSKVLIFFSEADQKISRAILVKTYENYVLYQRWDETKPQTHTAYSYEYCVPDPDAYGPDYPKGWYIRNTGDQVYVMVCDGEKPSSGYGIFVTGVEYDYAEDTVIITVISTRPGADDFGADVLLHPCCTVHFDKIPEKIRVIRYDGSSIGFVGNITDASD